jgi:membrane complex biogenesis BtpA family protein
MKSVLKSGALIGMVHVQALPGTPRSRLGVGAIAERASDEAALLVKAGFDALIIENMHDAPYVAGAQGPEIVAAMTRVGLAVRSAAADAPLGVQLLACGNKEALAVALAVGASFVRVENFVFAHVADEGLLPTAEAGQLLRYRRAIGAEHIKVFADVKKKHASHAITADVDIGDAAQAAEFFGADGIIVTGAATGRPVDAEELAMARGATELPLLVGSGVTPDNAGDLLQYADGLIVGSWCKRAGVWSNAPDAARCRRLAQAVRRARKG